VFEEAATKKRIKLGEYTLGTFDIQAMFDNIGKPRELTFYSVMDKAFLALLDRTCQYSYDVQE
jgi:hypothetical protein